jgi:hypothetical protein
MYLFTDYETDTKPFVLEMYLARDPGQRGLAGAAIARRLYRPRRGNCEAPADGGDRHEVIVLAKYGIRFCMLDVKDTREEGARGKVLFVSVEIERVDGYRSATYGW